MLILGHQGGEFWPAAVTNFLNLWACIVSCLTDPYCTQPLDRSSCPESHCGARLAPSKNADLIRKARAQIQSNSANVKQNLDLGFSLRWEFVKNL